MLEDIFLMIQWNCGNKCDDERGMPLASMTPPSVRIRRAVLTSLALWCESRDLSYVGNFEERRDGRNKVSEAEGSEITEAFCTPHKQIPT